jgi:hypothetical protein
MGDEGAGRWLLGNSETAIIQMMVNNGQVDSELSRASELKTSQKKAVGVGGFSRIGVDLFGSFYCEL